MFEEMVCVGGRGGSGCEVVMPGFRVLELVRFGMLKLVCDFSKVPWDHGLPSIAEQRCACDLEVKASSSMPSRESQRTASR